MKHGRRHLKATLKIEAIGQNTFEYARFIEGILKYGGLGGLLGYPKPHYWAAKITGRDPKYGYARSFLRPKIDYAKSNSAGSRGVFLWYIFESGEIYEVSSPVSWKRTRRYFCMVTEDGDIVEIGKEEVEEWINEHSA